MCSEHLAENTIRGVTYGVANGHEESIVNDQVSDVSYQESLANSGTARHTVCAAVAELSSRH